MKFAMASLCVSNLFYIRYSILFVHVSSLYQEKLGTRVTKYPNHTTTQNKPNYGETTQIMEKTPKRPN